MSNEKIKCPRCEKEGEEAPCPFDEDVHNEIRECDCCKDCRHQCAMDI